MQDILAGLLAPYRRALAGEEMDEFDPVYSQIANPQTLESLVEEPTEGGGNLSNLQALARRMAAKRGWTGPEWAALNQLVQKESSWNPTAQNPTSSAYGLFQFLDQTRANYGLKRGAGPRKQIRAGLDYIADRYGDPASALDFHRSNNWY